MDRLKTKAYGKLNLMLNISGVREDGYHTLETVMQTVALYDTIEIKLRSKKGISLSCDLPYVPSDERNIAWKAAQKYVESSGFDGGMHIDIKKMIPVGGGMAGGSTNAAAVLNILEAMCGGVGQQKLAEIALSLGADVPFCLHTGTYLAEGIGEVLTRLPDMPKCHIVVCKPRASVSSKNAYGVYDTYINKQNYDHKLMLAALEAGDIYKVANAMGNSFEAPIGAENPEILQIKQRMLDMKALNAAMTGSGSVVFGIFDDIEQAHACKAVLRQLKYRTYCVKPVN